MSALPNSTVVRTHLRQSGYHEIVLCRSDKANSLDAELVAALHNALVTAYDVQARLVVIRSEGRHFCGGFDFTDLGKNSEGDLALRFLRIEELFQLLRHAPFFSVAVVKGAALGAGADLVAACTQRIGTENAWFKFPGYRFGLALGTRRLSYLVGESVARSFLCKDAPITANEARETGLLTSVVEEVQIDEVIDQLAVALAKYDSGALAALLKNTMQSCANADADLGMLARSVCAPEIHARINAFREESKNGRVRP